MTDYLSALSGVQRDAATDLKGASLIIAGAGSGKTRVLTYRIAHAIRSGIKPYNILSLTFTNKAAKEMKERMETVVSHSETRMLWMGTFHSIFARILRSEAEHLGFTSNFTIYDSADSKNVIRQVCKELQVSDDYYKPGDIASRISLAKNNLIMPDAYAQNPTLIAEDREKRRPQFAQVYKMYVQRCHGYGAMDFDDLLLYMNILLRDFPDVLAKYQTMFQMIMVDEYQDTNMAQYMIVKKLSQAHGNICVVGDDAQSIYSFRGAKIENILRFQKDFPTAKVYKLEQNYRSTQTIVNAAGSLIEKNRRQLKKTVFSKGDVGEKIRIVRGYTDREEAMLVSGDIFSTARSEGIPYSSFAILYRTNAQSRVFEESLRGVNIPYKIRGGMSFYARKEIKDILAYMRLIVNQKDDEALMRIINYPTRGIGDVTIDKIRSAAREAGVNMWEMICRIDVPENPKGATAKILQFKSLIDDLSLVVNTKDALEAINEVITKTGIVGGYRMAQTPENMSALENIEELVNSVQSFVESTREEQPDVETITIGQWLENVALLTEADTEDDTERNYVTLMTIHSAKGLEFENVYIVGMEDNLFPSQMCMTSMEGLEEERRLFYVALTRAKKRVMLSLSQSRYQWGKPVSHPPSRFLKEIDSEYVDIKYSADDMSDSEDDDNDRPTFGGGRFDRPARPVRYEKRVYPQPEAKPVEAVKPVAPDMSKFKKVVGARSGSSDSGSGSDSAVEAGSLGGIVEGAKVRHDKFGVGVVENIEGSANGLKITILFADAYGQKTLLMKYAKLEVLVG